MQKQSSKREISEDVNVIALHVVEQTTGEYIKNPNAVALGRLGGLKGGKARAEKLSAERRKEIAQKAARERWSKI
ncbi:MAG: hypothetical protein WC549_09770 [Actinomycetota bacterium]